jgi:hypothetical protein
MKKNTLKSLALGIALLWNNPAHATAGISPPATPFIGSGGGNIVNGTEIWACQWNWTMQSGPSIGGSPARATGGTMSSGVGTINPNCSWLTVDASTFSITSSSATGGNGVFHGLRIRKNGVIYCTTTSNVPFQYLNNINGTTDSGFFFNSVTVGQCNWNALLKTAPDLNVVP